VRKNLGQSLLELALCAPIVILLALGTAATVEIADARAGLDAATEAAAGAVVRAPDAASGTNAAQARFASVVIDYPLRTAALHLSVGDFSRGGEVTASSTAFVDIGWAAMLLLPGHVTLQSQVVLRLEPWRTHRPAT
jgi:Flp pilus assembly protein TadG